MARLDMPPETNDLNYKKSEQYWKDCPSTIDSMLGGFSTITKIDLKGSEWFYHKLNKRKDGTPPNNGRALDVGAGIGRVSKGFLSHFFQRVDMLEQNEQFLIEAKKSIESIYPVGHDKHGVCENFFCSGLLEFEPLYGCKYDIIWIQWVLGYIKDNHVVDFFQKCVSWLAPNGVIVVKENISKVEEGEYDSLDSSITRSFHQYDALFKEAKLQCIFTSRQKLFPQELYKVQMFALRGIEN